MLITYEIKDKYDKFYKQMTDCLYINIGNAEVNLKWSKKNPIQNIQLILPKGWTFGEICYPNGSPLSLYYMLGHFCIDYLREDGYKLKSYNPFVMKVKTREYHICRSNDYFNSLITLQKETQEKANNHLKRIVQAQKEFNIHSFY